MQSNKDIIRKFREKKILVIGDAMLDVYVRGSSSRLCREAPVPIVAVSEQEKVPGGAANTAVNITALGGKCFFLSVIGNDDAGKQLIQVLKANKINTQSIVVDATRKTLSKQRVLADDQLIVRFDFGSTKAIDPYIEFLLMEQLETVYKQVDAVIISDYEYGVLSDAIIKRIDKVQKEYNKKIIIDAKNLEKYAFLAPTAVKPNYHEAAKLLNLPVADKRMNFLLEKSAQEELFKKTGANTIALTVDKDGAVIFQKELENPYRTYSRPVANVKAAGAGDTYVSTFALALSAEANVITAADLAASASSVVIKKEGTVACTIEELVAYIANSSKEVTDIDLLKKVIFKNKREGKRIVFTNGCFDILHGGHVSYLNAAKKLGEILIVGINSDNSVKKLKGNTRPINTLEDRIHVLAGLSCIDYIIPFEEETPVKIIKGIQPDIFVKGGDYKKETIPEAKLVEELGGIVEILPYVESHSTTEIINKITKISKVAQVHSI